MHRHPARHPLPLGASPRASGAHAGGSRRGERGVSIVLAMLVLFVIVVVVFEVRYSAAVELDQAHAVVFATRMGWLADAARQQAQSVLLADIEQANEGAEGGGLGGTGGVEDGGGDAASAGADSLFGGGGDSGDAAAEDQQASIADTTANTDSRLDEWMNPAALAPTLGQDFQMLVEVVDEDGKLNVLGLWSTDKEQREPFREIMRRLLDKAFEGTSRDISFADATDILDRFDDWVNGNRGTFDPIPKPELKPSNAQDEAQDGEGLDTSFFDTEGTHFPLTLGELSMIDGILPEHMSGFVEDDEFHPGLEDYLTIYSNLEVKPKPAQDELDSSPFTKGSLFDKSLADVGSDSTGQDPSGEEGDTDDLMAEPTNDGLVNVNTAPWAVLRALAPEDIPSSFIDKIVEFRLRIDELAETNGLSNSSLLSAFDNGSDQGQEDGNSGSGFGDEEEDDIVKFVFESPDEVISKVEDEYKLSLNLDPGIASEFTSRLDVTSQVFTIKVLLVDPETNRRSSWRTIVWRMKTPDGARIVTLLPLEPFHDPRRLKDFPGDLDDLSEQRAMAANQR